MAEDVWASRVHAPAVAAARIARERELYVDLDVNESSPIRPELGDHLLSIDAFGVMGSTADESAEAALNGGNFACRFTAMPFLAGMSVHKSAFDSSVRTPDPMAGNLDASGVRALAKSSSERVFVAGIGMIPFAKPGMSLPYDEMGAQATKAALADSGVEYDAVEQAYAGYVYGDSTSGQKALYHVGMTGIPVINVNNNCSSGSSALFLARQAIESGIADCVLAVGFEQMAPGAIGSIFEDRPSTFAAFDEVCDEIIGHGEIPLTLRFFGGAGLSHMEKYGTTLEDFARVRVKASRHAANNDLAVFRNIVSVDEVLESKAIWPGVMTRLMACPPSCGGAAALLVSEKFADKHGLRKDVEIIAQSMQTDLPSTFAAKDMMQLVGYNMTIAAAQSVYQASGLGPEDIDVVELHDCFAQNELITYEGLGLCETGEAQKFIAEGDNTYGGKVVTNPSGGLLSKGHPLGATGLAQCYELTQQLRGSAGKRQVSGAKTALQHNLGLGGACVVTLYQAA